MNQQEYDHLKRMVQMLTSNLSTYEEQAAGFGSLYVPPFIVRQIEETKEELRIAKQKLAEHTHTLVETTSSEKKATHNLPANIDLVDREKELDIFLNVLLHSKARLLQLNGFKGVGKTALLKELGHALLKKDEYEGIIWVSSQDQPLTISQLVNTIGYVLDYKNLIELPVDQKFVAAQTLLRTTNTLLMIDKIDYSAELECIKFLNNLPAPSQAIIINDAPTTLFDNVYTHTLRGLEKRFLKELIRKEADRLQLPGVAKLPESIFDRIFKATSGNPQAVRMAIGQIRRGATIDGIVENLEKAQGEFFDSIYENSWKLLSENSIKLLLIMTLFGGSVSLDAITNISELQNDDLTESLIQLAELYLIETNGEIERSKIRYDIISLTRYFAQREFKKLEENVQQELSNKVASYMAKFCRSHSKDFDLLQLEYENLKTITKWTALNNSSLHNEMVRSLYPFYRDCGYWEQALWHGNSSIVYTGKKNLFDEQGWILCQQASIYIRRGSQEDLEEADKCLRQAEVYFGELDNQKGLCAVYGRQARVLHKLGRLDDSLKIAQKALEIAHSSNLKSRVADIEHEMGDTCHKLGQLERAFLHYQESLKLFQELHDEIRIAGRYNDLGKVAIMREDWQEASSLFSKSIQLSTKHNKRDTWCRALNGLAIVEENLNNPLEAYQYAIQALEIAARLGAKEETNQAEMTVSRIIENIKNTKVIVFDFDNTLADTHNLHIESWMLAGQTYNYQLTLQQIKDVVIKAIASEESAKELRIGYHHLVDVVKLKRTLFRTEALQNLLLFPEVPGVIQALYEKGLVLAVASMNSEVLIREVLKRARIDQYFSIILGQESVQNKQPNPEILELVQRFIPVPQNNFFVVGDTPNDYQAAKLAGLRFIYCDRPNDLPFSAIRSPWKRISNLSELEEIGYE